MKAIFVGGHSDGKVMTIPNELRQVMLPIPPDPHKYDEEIRVQFDTEIYTRRTVSENKELAVYGFIGEVEGAKDVIREQIRVYSSIAFPREILLHTPEYVYDIATQIGAALYVEALRNLEKFE